MAGYRSSSRSRDVGSAEVFEPVVAALMMWDLHRAAGFRRITAKSPPVVGEVFVARVPWLPVGSCCEITEVIAEANRQGFRYRTLPGHPLEGDELFLVERQDGRTVFSVSERSRPARLVARLPGARAVQARINERYLAAADHVAATAP